MVKFLLIFLLFSMNSYAEDDNITMINEGGGNVIVVETSEGIIMIDSGTSEAAKNIIKRYPKVKNLLTTHRHYDHIGGNNYYGQNGATIIAQRKTADYLKEDKSINSKGRAKTVFDNSYTLRAGDEELQLIYLPNAHTDGDFMVYFPKKNYFHLADISFGDQFNFIDVPYGGTIDGLIDMTERILSMANDQSIITPGHGDVMSKKDLEKNLVMYQDLKSTVQNMKEQGLTLSQVQTQNPAKKYSSYDWTFINGVKFVEFIYNSL